MAGWFSKLISSGVVDTATGISNIVEKWAPGAEKKHEMALEIDQVIATSVADARSMSLGGTQTWFDSLVNGISRLIRPAITIYFMLALDGRLVQISTEGLDPVVLGWIEIVLIFWFGGRALFKDLPAVIKYMKALK